MAGLVPAIHVLLGPRKKDVDARDKRGHDEGEIGLSEKLVPRKGLEPPTPALRKRCSTN